MGVLVSFLLCSCRRLRRTLEGVLQLGFWVVEIPTIGAPELGCIRRLSSPEIEALDEDDRGVVRVDHCLVRK
ncbi:hypothetical protein DM860_005191 [Cuscuta australis]|uniref:Uncharacterized protein n=1 Tax=Cuscuta australis TaxID=267555 RepID=A0A328DMN1_9ASTE|nr:hypothetical protein DM860_005191 [Cuscuta australis]